MINAVNLLYLAVYVVVTLVQYAHLPAVRQFPYAYVWVAAAFSYPLCMALVRKRTGFGQDLIAILCFPVLAQALEAVIYLGRTHAFQHRQAGALVILGVYLIAPLAYTALWFPIGYLVSWSILRRRVRTSAAGRLT